MPNNIELWSGYVSLSEILPIEEKHCAIASLFFIAVTILYGIRVFYLIAINRETLFKCVAWNIFLLANCVVFIGFTTGSTLLFSTYLNKNINPKAAGYAWYTAAVCYNSQIWCLLSLWYIRLKTLKLNKNVLKAVFIGILLHFITLNIYWFLPEPYYHYLGSWTTFYAALLGVIMCVLFITQLKKITKGFKFDNMQETKVKFVATKYALLCLISSLSGVLYALMHLMFTEGYLKWLMGLLLFAMIDFFFNFICLNLQFEFTENDYIFYCKYLHNTMYYCLAGGKKLETNIINLAVSVDTTPNTTTTESQANTTEPNMVIVDHSQTQGGITSTQKINDLTEINDKGEQIGKRGAKKIIKVSQKNRIYNNSISPIDQYIKSKQESYINDVNNSKNITEYNNNDMELTRFDDCNENDVDQLNNDKNLIIYDIDNTIMTNSNFKARDFYTVFGGIDRLNELKNHFKNIKNKNNKVLFMGLSQFDTKTIKKSLNHVGLFKYFVHYNGKMGVSTLIGSDSKIHKKTDGKKHLTMMHLLKMVKKNYDDLLFVSNNKDDCKHFTNMNMCQVYYVETHGMTNDDMKKIQDIYIK